MRVLLVTYYFPPAGGGGVQRVLGWCRHLPEHGIELTVLAPEEPRWIDVDPTLVVPASVQVLRTADPSPAAVIPRAALAEVGGLRRLARRIALQPRRFAVPDIHRAWRRPAVSAALAYARDSGAEPAWDVVLSSSPPETTHLVASDIATALGIPWVADFRDSWLDLPHLRLSRPDVRAKHALNARLARRTLARARAATTVSEPLRRDLVARHPALDVAVVENGFEPDDVGRAAERASGFRDPGRFVVCYTGNFFGVQSPATFLDAVEAVLRADPMAREQLVVRFVGGLKPGDAERIERSGLLRDVVEHLGFVRHDDVLAHQAAADLLLLYVAPGERSEGVYTGKVFEYLAAARPVLALAPEGNVAATLLAEAGLVASPHGARVDPDDVPAVAGALDAALWAWRTNGGPEGTPVGSVDVPADLLTRFDRAQQGRRMAELLRGVAAG